jgi:hypothetical protein
MITIACVFKTGGEYKRSHVENLQAMVGDYPFVCLSDDPEVPGYVPLEHGWPGWWSKIELFSLKGPVLFFDLDTVIIGPLDDLVAEVHKHDFLILRDVYRGKIRQMAMQSSIMGWRGDMSEVYVAFEKNAQDWMNRLRSDQDYLEHAIGRATYWQDVLPGALLSYKVDVQGRGVPNDAKVVFFHGQPRPWQQDEVSYGRR